MLKPHPTNNALQALSLLDKLELLRVQSLEVEKALVHETSVKAKCVDRISKLSQTMSFQVVEHTQQLERVLAEKERVQTQLSAMARKFEGVSREVELLQQQVGLVKAARLETVASPVASSIAGDINTSSSTGGRSERALLQQFSSRLETAMHEAKAVVGLKDGVIRDLERRLSEFAHANVRLTEELTRQRQRQDDEAAALLKQLSDLRVQVQCGAEASAREATRSENERAAFRTRLSQLVLEIETLRARPPRQESVTHMATQTTGGADDVAESVEIVDQLARKTWESVAAYAASVASRRRAEALEVRVEELVQKVRKGDKKMRGLVSERKAHRSATEKRVLALMQRLEDAERQALEAERELAELRDAVRRYESDRAARASQTTQLQDANRRLETRCAEQLQAAETRFQQQLGDLEQALARRMLAREAHLAAEHDRKMRHVMDRHATELLARAIDEERSPHSPSSRSTLGSCDGLSSDSETGSPQRQQRSLQQLDALIGSKEGQYKRRGASSARSDLRRVAELEKKLHTLTQALAVANEQETLAKQHAQRIADAQYESAGQREELLEALNRLKQENWSLSLALQVTERQRR